MGIAVYALSPIDLIPDFIPVLGYLDNAILLPLAVMFAVRLIPGAVMAEHRATAAAVQGRPVGGMGAIFIVAVWVLAAAALAWWFWSQS